MLVLRAQTGPVFLTYRASRDIDTMVMEVTMTNAIFAFTASDGVQHTVWHVPDAVRFVHAFREIPFFTLLMGTIELPAPREPVPNSRNRPDTEMRSTTSFWR